MIELEPKACESCTRTREWDFAARLATAVLLRANNVSEKLIAGLDTFETEASIESGYGPEAREVATDITVSFAAEASAASSGVEEALDLVSYIDCDDESEEMGPRLECPRLSAFLLLLTHHLADVQKATGELANKGDDFVIRFGPSATENE